MTEVTSSSGSMVSARLGLVLNIRIRLPIISSGARVPMRREIWTRRLHGADIAGQAHHQLPGLLLVKVAKRKVLDLEEERFPQIARHAFPHLHGQDAVADRDHGAQDGDADHDQRRSGGQPLVVLVDALVDDRSIRRGMDRSMKTSEVSRIRATVARFQ